MRGKLFLTLLFVIFILPTRGYSTPIPINLDDLSSGTLINKKYRSKGVEFLSFYKENGSYIKSDTYVLSRSFDNETHNVITASPDIDYLNSHYIVVANFLRPIKYFSIYAYPSKAYTESWAWIKAFKAPIYDFNKLPGILKKIDATNTEGLEETLKLSRSSYDVFSVAFMGKGLRYVYFDNLSFDIKPVPEPSTIVLMTFSAISLLPFLRKRNQPNKRNERNERNNPINAKNANNSINTINAKFLC